MVASIRFLDPGFLVLARSEPRLGSRFFPGLPGMAARTRVHVSFGAARIVRVERCKSRKVSKLDNTIVNEKLG